MYSSPSPFQQQAGPPSFPFSHHYPSNSSNTSTPVRNHFAVNNNTTNLIYDEEYADISMLPSSEHTNPFLQHQYQQHHATFSPKTPEMEASFKETSKMLITPNTFNLNRKNQYLDYEMDQTMNLENVDPMTGRSLFSWNATPNKFTPNSPVLQQHSGNIANNQTFLSQNTPIETPRKQKMVYYFLLFRSYFLQSFFIDEHTTLQFQSNISE